LLSSSESNSLASHVFKDFWIFFFKFFALNFECSVVWLASSSLFFFSFLRALYCLKI
jgi:hypothetical protein